MPISPAKVRLPNPSERKSRKIEWVGHAEQAEAGEGAKQLRPWGRAQERAESGEEREARKRKGRERREGREVGTREKAKSS